MSVQLGIRTKMTISYLVLSSLVFVVDSSISSSHSAMKMDGGPRLVDTKSSFFRDFLKSRARRSPPNYEKNVPEITTFQLPNVAIHNQAMVHWSGNDSKVMYLLTRKKVNSDITDSTLWRSFDYGANFVDQTPKFENNAVVKSYFVSRSNNQKAIFLDGYNNSMRLWRSKDEGENYSPISIPFSAETIEFHPDNSDWVLGYDKFHKTLWCSQDFGENWTKLQDRVTDARYYWYVKGVDIGENAESIVHFEYENPTLLPQGIAQVKSCYIPDCLETEFQKQFDALNTIDRDSLMVQNDYILVQKSGDVNKLHVSYKRGPFVKARFPSYDGYRPVQSDFFIVSSDGKGIVIGVNHINEFSHLFFSNLQGNTFTRSLSNVRYFNKKDDNKQINDKKVYTVDIHEVQGVVGTYICNVHNARHGYNVTKITWDNGRTWSDIKEVYDENRNKITGCPDCQLNLHLSMDHTNSGYYIPSIITKKTIPGFIMAHGIHSNSLDDIPSKVSLFTSKDSGKTWHQARQKRHMAVVADHGAILVAIEFTFLKPVTSFDFSSDYGLTWKTYQFTSASINIDGILSEPGENSHYITLFGHKSYSDSWTIYRLDMRPVFNRTCVYPNDFENITLPVKDQSDMHFLQSLNYVSKLFFNVYSINKKLSENQCHLGLRQKAEMKKPDISCLIETDYKRVTYQKECQCTSEDYECDLGYRSENENCVRKENMDDSDFSDRYYPMLEEQMCSEGNKNVSSGWRKIPGDRCEGELYDLLWQIVPCTNSPQTTTVINP